MNEPLEKERRKSLFAAWRMAVLSGFAVAVMAAAFRLDSFALSVVAMALVLAALWTSAHETRQARQVETKLRAKVDELAAELRADPLTGHLNRGAFNRVLFRLARNDSVETLVTLFFFDLNRFKEVNDTLGHDVGDQLLREVGQRAKSVLGGALALARIGGDEFAAVVPFQSEAETRRLAQDVVDAIGRPYHLGERLVEVSASVGVAIGDPAVHGGDELLRRADLAMYEVKGEAREGGNFHVFDDLLSNRQTRETSIRKELAKAEFSKRFELHYQPIVDARSGVICKAEALLRSQEHAMLGIPPSLMVSVAEDSGQIVELTEWTIDQAIGAAKQLCIPVAVNLSPAYFKRADFADRLIERLVTSDVDPSRLIVEVTEGVLISDMKRARESIELLRGIGVKVYLDDFGTGYSSLSYLQNFELDGMKLDRSFIQDLGRSEKVARIVRAMIDFAHSLDMKTVVEGVESEWQARMVQLQGCDFLQGYQLGVPMPVDDLHAILNADPVTGQAQAG